MERRRSIVVCIIGSYISGLATSGEGSQAPEPPSVRTKIAPPLLFTQCSQGGLHFVTSSPPFSPSTNPPSTNPPRTNRLPAPILTSSLLYEQPPPNTSSPYRHPFPQIAPPSSPPYYSLHTLHRVHIWDTYHPYTSLSHREYTPSTSDPRISPPDHLQRALRGTQYARGSVHACTLLCTHVYSNVYTRV